MQCPQCNAVVIAGSSHCLYCRAPLPTQTAEVSQPRFAAAGSRDLRRKFAPPKNQHRSQDTTQEASDPLPRSVNEPSTLKQSAMSESADTHGVPEEPHSAQGPLQSFLARGDLLDGKFKLLEEIGRGGMGFVYRSVDVSLNREVAVKVLPPHYNDDESVVGRFRREARAMASLDHPNIVTVYSIGYEHGLHYFAMKLLHGETLAHTLKRVEYDMRAPITAIEMIDLLVQACHGLEHAHSKSLLHRDIKPGNLMLTPGGGLTIMDFGIVKDLGGSDSIGLKTAHGKIFGTPEYMPPEQAMGKGDYSPASDLYALAVVGYELLCGELPYTADTPIGIIIQHIRADIPQLKGRAAGQYAVLESIFRKALAKDPRERYESAAQLRTALLGARQTLSSPQVNELSQGAHLHSSAERELEEMITRHSESEDAFRAPIEPVSSHLLPPVPSTPTKPPASPLTAPVAPAYSAPSPSPSPAPSPATPRADLSHGDHGGQRTQSTPQEPQERKSVELQRASKRAGHYTILRRKP